MGFKYVLRPFVVVSWLAGALKVMGWDDISITSDFRHDVILGAPNGTFANHI